MLGRKAYLSTTILLVVGTFDLVTTLMWLHEGQGEGNPVFARIAQFGGFALVAAKLTFLYVPVLILEYARKKRPLSAEIGTWIAAGLYLYLYGSHLLAIRKH